jgi:hypothetical protein
MFKGFLGGAAIVLTALTAACAGQVFFGPFSMVQLPPRGTDVIIPPPVIEVPLGA